MAPINFKNKLEDDCLDLSMMSLKEVPIQEIVALKKKVKRLDLSNNEIESLPRYFASSLSHITKLDLARNKLTQLPANFGELSSLKHLDLYNNQLTELPNSFANLQELRFVDLKSNPLEKDFAAAAGDCSNYKECSTAARNLLLLTKSKKKEYENQLAMRQAKEKEMEKARQQKEQEKNRKKNEKKQAMEAQKRQEQKENKKSSAQSSVNGSTLSNGHKKAQNSNSAKSVNSVNKNAKKSSGGLSCLAWVNFVLFVLLLISGVLCFYIYSEGDFSVNGGYKALQRLETNVLTILIKAKPYAEWTWVELQVIGGRVSEGSQAMWQSLATWFDYSLQALEKFTGDMSPLIESTRKTASTVWGAVVSYVLYAATWSKNLLDLKFWVWALEELKSFGQFLWAQVLVVWEEIGNNQAVMNLWKDCGGVREVFWNAVSWIVDSALFLYTIIQTKVVPELSKQVELGYNWVVLAIEQVSS